MSGFSKLGLGIGMLLICFACTKAEKAPSEAKAVTAEATPAKAEPAAAAAPEKGFQRCAGSLTAGNPTKITTANGDWELTGSTLSWKAGESDDTLTIGLIADIKEASEANLKNVNKFVADFKAAKVDMIAVAGDIAEKQEQMESVLTALAGSGLPVGVLIGNREGVGAFQAALGAVQTKHSNIVNLNQVRRVDTPNADIVSLPGYFKTDYLHAADGCTYGKEELAGLAQLKAACDSTVILISHGGPKQDGADAIDRTSEGANVGDPALAKSMSELGIKFGIFANIHEAGGRGTDLAGKKLEEGQDHESLLVNPGPVDSVRWVMNDKSESTGMAAVMTVKGGKASYKVLRAN